MKLNNCNTPNPVLNYSMDLEKRSRWRIIMVVAVVIITSFCVQQYFHHKGHGDIIEEKEDW